MPPTIFVDLDDVLADFKGAAMALHGKPDHKPAPNDPWDLASVLGISAAQFWQPINELGAEFWAELKPLPWCFRLLDLVSDYTPSWYILTSPSFCPSSYVGKIRWMREHIHGRFNSFIITGHKHLLATPNSILVDDRLENCEKFVDAGGMAFHLTHSKDPSDTVRIFDELTIYLKARTFIRPE